MWEVTSATTVPATDEWLPKAACRGPESALFFPPAWSERRDERGEREARAKAICESCNVRRPCLEFAVAINEQHGIWGGLNESERRHLLASSAARQVQAPAPMHERRQRAAV
ncbi:MAG: WhiB family transcriptional regulator [Acidimicrobiia bacterium]|nr:WhiB family transcriptional regulator [Acidimicrobiia bacterium]